MKITVRLSETDIRALIAKHLGVNVADVTIHHAAAMQDGPHYSPASMRAEVENIDIARLAAD